MGRKNGLFLDVFSVAIWRYPTILYGRVSYETPSFSSAIIPRKASIFRSLTSLNYASLLLQIEPRCQYIAVRVWEKEGRRDRHLWECLYISVLYVGRYTLMPLGGKKREGGPDKFSFFRKKDFLPFLPGSISLCKSVVSPLHPPQSYQPFLGPHQTILTTDIFSLLKL